MIIEMPALKYSIIKISLGWSISFNGVGHACRKKYAFTNFMSKPLPIWERFIVFISLGMVAWYMMGSLVEPMAQEFYKDILDQKNYIPDRRRILRQRAGMRDKDTRVAWQPYNY